MRGFYRLLPENQVIFKEWKFGIYVRVRDRSRPRQTRGKKVASEEVEVILSQQRGCGRAGARVVPVPASH